MGDERSASERCGPGGTVTKWLPDPSFPFKVLTKEVRMSLLATCKIKFWYQSFTKNIRCFFTSSPKLTRSTLTFSFFNLLASLTSSFSSISTGLPTNATILILWFLPWRCFKASWIEICVIVFINYIDKILTWAMRIPVRRLMFPLGCTKCSFDMMRPTSVVSVAKTSTLKKNIILFKIYIFI